MSLSFWKDKKVLMTGHTGFKGSWLSLWLQNLGAKIIGYSLPPPTQPSLFEIARADKKMVSIIGDVRNFDFLKKVFIEERPEIILHMAAQSLVRHSYLNPVETYSTNIMGTVNVLEAARQTKSAKVIIIVTSDKCYENKGSVWSYPEYEPMGGYDPYSSSKGCAELVTAAYRNSFFNPNDYQQHGTALASVRAGNVIGGGDWAEDRLIPDIMRAIMNGRKLFLRNPDSIRPWEHVLEPLHGYIMLAEKLWEEGPLYSEPWNFGPQDADSKPVSWIVEKVSHLWGSNIQYKLDDRFNLHEARSLRLDCSKAKLKLHWSSYWNLDTALREVVSWYKAYYSQREMHRFTLDQIDTYSSHQTILN